MKASILFSWLLALFAMPTTPLEAEAQPSNSQGNIQFACGQSYDRDRQEYIFTTFAWNSQHKKPIINWSNESLSDAGFDPQQRCEEVSPRFQEAYSRQSLKYLTHGTMDAQSVICTSSRVGGDCQTLLLTLLADDDPLVTLEQLSDILLGYASSPLQQSSDERVQEIDDRIYIEVDVEEFLASPEQ